MARGRPARTPTPGQLTLDDWAEMLNESRERLPPGERAGDPKRPVRRRSNRADGPEDRGHADGDATLGSRTGARPPTPQRC